MLVSGVQQSDSVIRIHIPIFFRFFYCIGYYRILSCDTVENITIINFKKKGDYGGRLNHQLDSKFRQTSFSRLAHQESLRGEIYLLEKQRSTLCMAVPKRKQASGSAHPWQSKLRAWRPVLQTVGLHRHLAESELTSPDASSRTCRLG